MIDESKQRSIDLTLATQYDVINRKAKDLIRLCLTNSIMINFHEEPTTKQLWKKLSEIYEVIDRKAKGLIRLCLAD